VQTTSERRKNDRVPFSHALRVRKLDAGEQAMAEARDLSVAGMGFETFALYTVGEELRIHLTNVIEQSAIPARVRSVVQEGNRFRVGVEHLPEVS
jgi:hypothetical protein